MDVQTPNTLPKKERLCGKTGIEKLLAKGRHGNVSDLRYIYLTGTEMPYNRILVSVPKKFFKRAVKRNLIKRRVRESYRLNKEVLAAPQGYRTNVLFVYISKEIKEYAYIEERLKGAMELVSQRKTKDNRNNGN